MADGTPGAGLQDHRRLPQGQWPAIRAVCARFVALCRRLDLFDASRGDRRQQVQGGEQPRQNFTRAKIKRRMEQVEASIARYLAALERPTGRSRPRRQDQASRLKEKIAG